MTTSSIGTAARTYSTLQAWENAAPANLVTSTDPWIGECYNDSEFTSATEVLNISGITTNATYFVTLRCATGQSFRDNASIRSTALDYNVSNGVGIRCTGNYYKVIQNQVNYTVIQDLQIKDDGPSNSGAIAVATNDIATIKNCIIKAGYRAVASGANTVVYNCLLLASDASTGAIDVARSGSVESTYIGCTLVKTGSAGGTAISKDPYAAMTLKDCAVFNFTTFVSGAGGSTAGSGYNCTDLSAAFSNTGDQVSKTFANQFENTASDFRAKAGGDLINNGTTDSNIDPDISRTTRSGTPTIGCWEYSAGAAAFIAKQNAFARQAVNRASVY